MGQFPPNFGVEGKSATIRFGLIDSIGQWITYNFIADDFHIKKLCSQSTNKQWTEWDLNYAFTVTAATCVSFRLSATLYVEYTG